MAGYSFDDFREAIERFNALLDRPDAVDDDLAAEWRRWVEIVGPLTDEQKIRATKALISARLCSIDALFKWWLKLTTTWHYMSGSGTLYTSSYTDDELTLSSDFTYRYHKSGSTAAYSPSFGGSFGSSTVSTDSTHRGVFVISEPDKAVLFPQHGGCLEANYYESEYTLMVSGLGIFWVK